MEVWIVFVVEATKDGKVVYSKNHEYEEDARNDYALVSRILDDCDVEMYEDEA